MSRALVLAHSWDAVREVLLHEMAHQMAEEALGVHSEPAHGSQFRLACRLLQANPSASENFKPLDDRILREDAPADKMTLRIKKLLALASSPDRHEAEAAMAKAHELVAKYNIDQWQREEDRTLASVFLGQPALRHSPEDYSLANLLQDFYFVRGIWVAAYVAAKGKMGRVLEISGTPANIKLAHYIHDFVRRVIRSQWENYNRGRSLNRRRQTDFALGVLEGFRLKLESARAGKEKNSGPFSLMKTEDPLLKKYFSCRYPRTVRVKGANSPRDMTVIKDGRNLGKNLVIFKPVADKSKDRCLRLGS